MTFEQLLSFSALAKNLNFTKTSEIIHVSQPTLSRQILLLEDEFQVKLFIRDNKSMHLSSAGAVFLEECNELLLRREKLLERMRMFSNGTYGRIVYESLQVYYPELIQLYRDFCKTYPNVRFTAQNRPTGLIRDSVAIGRGDFGICFSFEIEDEETFEIVPLFKERFCVILSDTHPLARFEKISIDMLQNEKFIFLGYNQFPFIRHLWESLDLTDAVEDGQIQSPDSIDTILLNVRSGTVGSIIPAPVARENIQGCAMLDLEGLDTTFFTVLFWNRNNTNPAFKVFLDFFYERFPFNKNKENVT